LKRAAHREEAQGVRFADADGVAKLIAAIGAFRADGVHDSCDGLVIGVDTKADEFSRANLVRMAAS